jgi:hypothetical protein
VVTHTPLIALGSQAGVGGTTGLGGVVFFLQLADSRKLTSERSRIFFTRVRARKLGSIQYAAMA